MNSLNLSCPINTLGYGISSYNIWKNLRSNLDISFFPIGNVEAEGLCDKDGLIEDLKKQTQHDLQAPCLKIWHAHDLINKPHSLAKYACYTYFELDNVTESEKHGYDICDIIFVPSHWAKGVLVDNNIDSSKIVVAPSGVDLSVFDKDLELDPKEQGDLNNEDYIFVNIGKWEIRKGHDVLIHAFNKAFNSDDNVKLWMCNSNPFISAQQQQQWSELYKKNALGEKVKLFPRLPTQQSVAKIIKLANCGIYPSRAEGWNNEVIETMAMNKPVIVTNYSAHTEYCNKDNSLMVNIKDKEIAQDGMFFNGTGSWAKLSYDVVDELVEHMRYAYRNRIIDNPKGFQTASDFNWKKTSDIIIKHIYE